MAKINLKKNKKEPENWARFLHVTKQPVNSQDGAFHIISKAFLLKDGDFWKEGVWDGEREQGLYNTGNTLLAVRYLNQAKG